MCAPGWRRCETITSAGWPIRKIQGTAGKARRITGSRRACQLSNFTKNRCSSTRPGCPSMPMTVRSQAPRRSSPASPPRNAASTGGASAMTRFAAAAASAWHSSVDPQRDMWKMKPSGVSPGCSCSQRASTRTSTSRRNAALNGSRRHASMLCSKNGSRNGRSPTRQRSRHSVPSRGIPRMGTHPSSAGNGAIRTRRAGAMRGGPRRARRARPRPRGDSRARGRGG